MLRFLLLTLTVCLGCALTIGAAVAVGRTQPPSEAVRWFHMDDCEQPCLMGVTVGQTTLNEAKQKFGELVVPLGYTTRLKESQSLSGQVITLFLEDSNSIQKLTVEVASPDTVASYLDMEKHDDKFPYLPTLADMISLYGAPVCLKEYKAQIPYTFIYFIDHDFIITAIIFHKMRFDSPLDSFSYSLVLDDRLCACRNWQKVASLYPRMRGCFTRYP